ncbi:MAG: pfkB family carbohydrate kinase [Planctomycetes bacterium ADurb.Bin401]|nr:MAG: pfkB family carbohydrate kinase [Planctomycetes bacterium ADurb.Bin401]
MSTDVLVLNTAVTDFRSKEFSFVEKLTGPGGLAKCKTSDMPAYTQEHYKQWIDAGMVTAGGPGNTAPLIAKACLKAAVGVNLGKGDFGGLDAQGRYFYDMMAKNNVDMSQTFVHDSLPTGTTFIYEKINNERGGLAYFPNANNDFDFEYFKKSVEKLNPKIVFYMYSGLSDRGDANGGKDLADFIKWCRQKGIATLVDSHTLTGNPQKLIEEKAIIAEYALLKPLLGELDIFFTSYDEARMIANAFEENIAEQDFIINFLRFLSSRYVNFKIFGVTVKDGAYVVCKDAKGNTAEPKKITSRFMGQGVKDLVGAGDSFRAGVVTYLAKNIEKLKNDEIDIEEAIQMGNLFASLYIKSPLNDRYGNIKSFTKMLEMVRGQ